MIDHCGKCGNYTMIDYEDHLNDANLKLHKITLCRHCVEQAIRYAIVECEWL